MMREVDKLVSIVIPCYNNEPFIEDAIASAVNQTYNNVEIIVIDDGSTDKSLEIIRLFENHIQWETSSNQGAPKARNRGLELARGEYIKFLDADDILLPDSLERQVEKASQLSSERKAIIYGDAIWINRDGKPLPNNPLLPRKANEDPVSHILSQCPLTSCPLHKRDYLLEIGGFDPLIPKGQEHDLHLRLVLAGVEFVYHSGAVYQYREYSDTNRISDRGLSQKGAMIHFEILQQQCRKIKEQTKTLSPDVRKILARRFWAYGRAILRKGYIVESKSYFETARELDAQNCIIGNPPYPMLVQLLGATKAEYLTQKLKGLMKPSPA
ncbi:glycosyltransferase family 2 protein [Rivularia sp. UHCC 0363]|uniref:glycosyltransferase family 2 protein n=1 Tax=Rivularia sp. UHCC 0363 TaxID=3110244 RepID=UPI002B21A9CF|nr:glycosyltransferase [Rivularia sp. UHCC 0363]MEA5596126.1 glycosyltransferase [Rivularia sp. UHCC 0363]